MSDYHTALGNDVGRWPRLECHDGKHGVTYASDLNLGIPVVMYQADVWYSDLPWRDGYTKFADRAGVQQARPYSELLERLGKEIRENGPPTVLITGKHAIRHLIPEAVAEATLNGGSAVACLWGFPAWEGVRDAEDILRELARAHNCVGDFCCGYGRAGRVFAQAGKRYVMSDLNPECVGYIAAHEGEWA